MGGSVVVSEGILSIFVVFCCCVKRTLLQHSVQSIRIANGSKIDRVLWPNAISDMIFYIHFNIFNKIEQINGKIGSIYEHGLVCIICESQSAIIYFARLPLYISVSYEAHKQTQMPTRPNTHTHTIKRTQLA